MQVDGGTELSNGIIVPKYYNPGLGYSPASGPPVGGLGVGANPRVYSSTFFGDDVKALLPPTNAFGKRKRKGRLEVRYVSYSAIFLLCYLQYEQTQQYIFYWFE